MSGNNEIWEKFVPEEQHFKLGDIELIIPSNLDLYNDYRKYFLNYSHELTDQAVNDYKSSINDYFSFVEKAPEIYLKYLDMVGDKAMDILIANEIYSISKDDFKKRQMDAFHLTIDYVTKFAEEGDQKVNDNAAMAGKLFGFMYPQTGGVIASKENYNSAVRSAKLMNGFNSFMGKLAVKRAAKLDKWSAGKIYNDINSSEYFNRLANDLFCSYIIVTNILRENGADIWANDSQKQKENENIFRNISNPNFPQDKKMKAFADVFLASPYNRDYIKFIEEDFGNTDEVKAIKEYFGFE